MPVIITEGNITKKPRKIACWTCGAQEEKKIPKAIVANINTSATNSSKRCGSYRAVNEVRSVISWRERSVCD